MLDIGRIDAERVKPLRHQPRWAIVRTVKAPKVRSRETNVFRQPEAFCRRQRIKFPRSTAITHHAPPLFAQC
jgi:hypothetical protein